MSFGVFIGVINFANIIADMICCAVIGFFLVGLVPISFNFSGEMAYPESEATSSAQGSTHRSRVGPRQPDSVLNLNSEDQDVLGPLVQRFCNLVATCLVL